MPSSAPMMLRLLSVGACAMTAIAFATMKKDKRIDGSIVVESENAGGSKKDGQCDCIVSHGQQSFFSPAMLTPGRAWTSGYAYGAFNNDYEKCFSDTSADYEDCKGDNGENLFKSYACGDYSDGPANGIVPSSFQKGDDYFDALIRRLPARYQNALKDSYNGVGDSDQPSSYTFCNGFGASGGFPPAPPGKIYNNFACNKLIDNKMYEAANSVSLDMGFRDGKDACNDTLADILAATSATFDSGTLCELLYKDTGVWIQTSKNPPSGIFKKGAKFCEMRATDSGTMGCQWHAEPYITEGCPTMRAPSAPPATGRRS